MSDINELTKLGLRWYVAHTYSGYEKKVKQNLEKIVENRGLGDRIVECIIPTELVVEQDGDKQKEVEHLVFPSYVLVKMIMNEETWHVVRNIRGVTGFVGPGSYPEPLSDTEVEQMNVEVKSFQLSFGVGDTVVINKGIFAGYKGKVQEISEDNKTVTVLVATGRRETPVYVDISDVKADKSAQ